MKVSKMFRKIGKSILRIIILLGIILSIPILLYCVWQPGKENAKGAFDLGQNAIWLGHGWLGDNSWFERNKRNTSDFHSKEKISTLMQNLCKNHIKFVFPHLCPAQHNGQIAPYSSVQVERFLDIAQKYNIKVIPWVGGVFEESARIAEPAWRKEFTASIKRLLTAHPRLAGVQLNIEPLPSGNQDFLILLDDLRPVLKNKILGVAAYPPPTKWHPFPSVHWELDYLKEVAKRSDQISVMMYDTAIKFEKIYANLMRQWTDEIQTTLSCTNCKLLLGIPAYSDADSGYHDPAVENMQSALSGIQASETSNNYIGCAIYCEWEMTPKKWKIWQSNYLKTDSK